MQSDCRRIAGHRHRAEDVFGLALRAFGLTLRAPMRAAAKMWRAIAHKPLREVGLAGDWSKPAPANLQYQYLRYSPISLP
jgi:hypothetical protein